MVYKKGSAIGKSIMIFFFIFMAFMGIIILGIFTYAGNIVNQSFESINFDIGDTNFSEVYDDTLGHGIDAALNQADNWGMTLLFGMCLLMVLCGFIFKEDNRIWLVAEILILVVAFITAVALQGAYNQTIHSSAELLDVYSTDLDDSSRFVLNLPWIVPILWMFIMIFSYGRIKRDKPKASQEFDDIGY